MKNFASVFFTACLLLTACTADFNETAEPTETEPVQHSVPMHLLGGIEGFEDEDVTRATTSWQDGDSLYLQYTTASGVVDGLGVYKNGQWNVEYYGNITEGASTACRVYRFTNIAEETLSDLTLTEQSAVYGDTSASYMLKNGVLTVTAYLKPLTGRLRFKGTSGQTVTFTGLKWYNRYALTGSLSQTAGPITLTAGSDGYTPYVYGVFADESTRQLTVELNDDYNLVRKFGSKVLATGKSGYINAPTMDSRSGWQLVDYTPQDFTVTGNGKTVTFKMIKVNPGTFQMGRAGSEDVATPVHSVTLTNTYFMGETEVTQGLWYAVMGQSPTSDGSKWSSSYGQGDNYPAYYISYEDCQKFLTKLNQLTGQQFRFPTEAEWEFAAKGGTKSQGYTYAGSNTIGDVAWYTENSGSETHEVKTKKANELGLYDMSGNVCEWCADWYGSYSSGAQTNPTGATSGSFRVYRGGSWGLTATRCRVAYRDYYTPSYRSNFLGFRLAL